jgi:hypothetical protein
MIVDCCNLENNLELLNVRLGILNPYVDKFLVFDFDNNNLQHDKVSVITEQNDGWNWDNLTSPLQNLGLTSGDLVIFSDVNEIPNLSELAALSEFTRGARAASFTNLTFSNFFNMKSFDVIEGNNQIDKLSHNSIACFYETFKMWNPQKIWDKRASLSKFDQAKGWRLEIDDSANSRKIDIEDYFPDHFVEEKDKYKNLIKP